MYPTPEFAHIRVTLVLYHFYILLMLASESLLRVFRQFLCLLFTVFIISLCFVICWFSNLILGVFFLVKNLSVRHRVNIHVYVFSSCFLAVLTVLTSNDLLYSLRMLFIFSFNSIEFFSFNWIYSGKTKTTLLSVVEFFTKSDET